MESLVGLDVEIMKGKKYFLSSGGFVCAKPIEALPESAGDRRPCLLLGNRVTFGYPHRRVKRQAIHQMFSPRALDRRS